MASRIYKNKLVKDRENKKEEKRKVLESNKKKMPKIDRMEEMYKVMMKMSDSDIEKRLKEIESRKQEIESRKDDIQKEIQGRLKKGENLGAEIGTKLWEESNKLLEESKKLEKEKSRLENFPKVKKQIERIRDLKNRTKKDRNEKYKEARLDLLTEKSKKMDKDNKEKEIKRLEIQNNKLLSKKDISEEDRNTYFTNMKRIDVLREEISSIDISEDRLKELEATVKKYELGNSKEDSVINKCDMAWKMLLAGKSWDEISLAAIEEVKDRKQAKKEREPHSTEQKTEFNKTEEIKAKTKVRNKIEYSEKEMEGKVSNEEIEKELLEDMKSQEQTNNQKSEAEESQVSQSDEKPKWYQFIKRFKNWNERRKQAKLPDAEPDKETNKIDVTNNDKSEKKEPEKTQRDAFMEALRVYAEKENTEKKKFGGLEAEKIAFEKIAKREIDQQQTELEENLKNMRQRDEEHVNEREI